MICDGSRQTLKTERRHSSKMLIGGNESGIRITMIVSPFDSLPLKLNPDFAKDKCILVDAEVRDQI